MTEVNAGECPRTEEELNSALRDLLHVAHENGVEVEGGWDVRNGAGMPDWDVVVTEIVRSSGTSTARES